MADQVASNSLPSILLRARDGFILHQTLYAAAKLGVADQLDGGWRSATELARQLEVNQDGLYRTLRLLASQGIFEDVPPGCRAYLMKSVIHDWDDQARRLNELERERAELKGLVSKLSNEKAVLKDIAAEPSCQH